MTQSPPLSLRVRAAVVDHRRATYGITCENYRDMSPERRLPKSPATSTPVGLGSARRGQPAALAPGPRVLRR